MTTLVRMQGIRKIFPGVIANEQVDLEIRAGEVLGLLGENGAGKSTLMSILYGLYRPDGGQIFVRDERVELRSPHDAIQAGIGMVHQHFMLIPVHTVVENILLGSKQKRLFPNWKSESERLARLSKEIGLPVDPSARVSNLPLGMQQRVEIVKALYYGAEILILDEPTGVLTPQEVEELLQVLRRLADSGKAVVLITHKLEEVMSVTDRVVVLRGGKNAGEVATNETNATDLARMMVGRDVLFHIDRQHTVGEDVVLKLDDVSVHDERKHLALKHVSLKLHQGEILGVAGIDGNGQRELAETIIGIHTPAEGHIEVRGTIVNRLSPSKIHRLGVGSIPEDRHASGLFLNFSVEENLILEQFREAPISRRWVLQSRAIREKALNLIEEFSIKTPKPHTRARTLSGGNQQKIVLARALAHQPRLVIAAQPTRGLDVGAAEYVRQRLIKQAQSGSAVLLISTELEEIMMLSDRIIVLYEGEVIGTVSRLEATRESIGLMMAGRRPADVSTNP